MKRKKKKKRWNGRKKNNKSKWGTLKRQEQSFCQNFMIQDLSIASIRNLISESMYNRVPLPLSPSQLASLKASINKPYVNPILKLLRRAIGNVTFDRL